MDSIVPIVLALAPSIGIGYLFYRIMRALLEGDRNERLAHSQWLAEHGEESDDTIRPGASPASSAGMDSGGRP